MYHYRLLFHKASQSMGKGTQRVGYAGIGRVPLKAVDQESYCAALAIGSIVTACKNKRFSFHLKEIGEVFRTPLVSNS